jgi:hypothetical protein
MTLIRREREDVGEEESAYQGRYMTFCAPTAEVAFCRHSCGPSHRSKCVCLCHLDNCLLIIYYLSSPPWRNKCRPECQVFRRWQFRRAHDPRYVTRDQYSTCIFIHTSCAWVSQYINNIVILLPLCGMSARQAATSADDGARRQNKIASKKKVCMYCTYTKAKNNTTVSKSIYFSHPGWDISYREWEISHWFFYRTRSYGGACRK